MVGVWEDGVRGKGCCYLQERGYSIGIGSQGRDMMTREPPWEQNGFPLMVRVIWIASAKS